MLKPNTAIRKQKIGKYTYVFLDKNRYSPETKRAEHERKYLGKLEDGLFVPNKEYKEELAYEGQNAYPPRSEVEKLFTFKAEVPVIAQYRIFNYGAVWLLEQIARVSGLRADLEEVFGELAETILQIAYFLVLNPKKALYLIDDWAEDHLIEIFVSSRRISELLKMINRGKGMEFYKVWSRRMDKDETLFYDITSISSYSKNIDEAEYGNNKQGEKLPQINVAILVGSRSRLPYYGRLLDGNIADVSTLLTLVRDMIFIDPNNFYAIFDRGFCSQANIDELFKNDIPFLMGLSRTWKMIEECRPEDLEEFIAEINRDPNQDVYISSTRIQWKKTKHHIYVHTYFSKDLEKTKWDEFHNAIDRWKVELDTNKKKPENQPYYNKFFIKGKDDGKHTQWLFNQKAISEHQRYFGWFYLISSYEADGKRALQTYKLRNLVEEVIGDIKNILNFKRLRVKSSTTLEGKFFIEFIALILLSWIKREMDDHDLFRTYTMDELLGKLNKIKLFVHSSGTAYFSEIVKRWRDIYEDMGVPVPTEEGIINEFFKDKN